LFKIFATDYDGTLATDGRVYPQTIAALKRLKDAGVILLLVTGRELDDLLRTFPEIPIFDWVVAENGALIYRPATQVEMLLAGKPSQDFIERIRAHGVQPLSIGRAIVATVEPHEVTVLEAIRDLGLELQVIFNKGAVMVLPAGVTKATGLNAVLKKLDIVAESVVGIGDAENDHAFLSICGLSVAVANALPALKERAQVVTSGDHGAGVVEIVERLLGGEFADLFQPVKTPPP
jgi:HAD superfamily hydrolase (TIGR01484 family)